MIAVGECLCGGVKFEVNTDLAKTGTTKEQRAYDGSEQNDVPETQEEGPTNMLKSIFYIVYENKHFHNDRYAFFLSSLRYACIRTYPLRL